MSTLPLPDLLAAVKELGPVIYESGLFGCKALAQGKAIAWDCLALGRNPFSFIERYHLMGSKVELKSETMLADFNSAGGVHEMIESTPAVATIKLALNGKTKQFSLSWETIAKEPFAYEGKEKDILAQLAAGKSPTLKSKYATPRSRAQMLWARLVSDSVRKVMPQATAGKYTPEEIADFVSESAAASAAAPPSLLPSAAEPPETPPPAPAVEPANGYCTASQSARIKELWGLLDAPVEKREATLAKRGVNTVRSLKAEQATEIITALEAALAKRASAAAAEAAGESKLPAGLRERATNSLVDQTTVAEIKRLLGEVNQIDSSIIPGIKTHLSKSGIGKVAELAQPDADALKAAIAARNIKAWVARELAKPEMLAAEGGPKN